MLEPGLRYILGACRPDNRGSIEREAYTLFRPSIIAIRDHGVPEGKQAGQHGCPGSGAQTAVRVGVDKADALTGQTVDVGRPTGQIAVAARRVDAKLIYANPENVRASGAGGRAGRQQRTRRRKRYKCGDDRPQQPPSRLCPRLSQYSRFVFRPGIGTGYLPSASGCSGAGESSVSLSSPGANS